MTTDYKVTDLFCVIDEFCKHFDAENTALSFKNVLFSRKACYFIGGVMSE